MPKPGAFPKCMKKWRRHRWDLDGECYRKDGPKRCRAKRNPKADVKAQRA